MEDDVVYPDVEQAALGDAGLACDGIDFSSEEKVRRGVERARCYVNIGLELLSHRDLERARDAAKKAETASKHQFGKFLLRQGRRWDVESG